MSTENSMKPIYIDYLNALDIDALSLTDEEILGSYRNLACCAG